MRIVANTGELNHHLGIAAKIAKSQTIPMLNSVRIAANGKVTITATDLECFYRGTLEKAESSATGEVCIPAKVLHAYTTKLPGATFSVDTRENHWVDVKQGGTIRAKICGMSAESFPDLPETAYTHEVDAAKLKRAIDQVVPFCGDIETTKLPSAAHFEFLDAKLRIRATDGHRMCEVEIPATGEPGLTSTLTHDSLAAVARFLSGASGAARIGCVSTGTSGNMFFAAGDAEFGARIGGRFPDVSRVIDKPSCGSVTVQLETFRKALQRVRVATEADRNRVTLQPVQADSELIIRSVKVEDGGEAETVEPVPIIARSGAILSEALGFNSEYLADFLAKADGPTVDIAYRDKPTEPLSLCGDGFRCWIMGLR